MSNPLVPGFDPLGQRIVESVAGVTNGRDGPETQPSVELFGFGNEVCASPWDQVLRRQRSCGNRRSTQLGNWGKSARSETGRVWRRVTPTSGVCSPASTGAQGRDGDDVCFASYSATVNRAIEPIGSRAAVPVTNTCRDPFRRTTV